MRRQIEVFKSPRSLRERFGHKLRIFLDTAYERGTSDFYEQSIKPALLSPRYLVVATPDAVSRVGGIRRGATDEWLRPTLVAAAFDAGDAEKAEDLAYEVVAAEA
ncbi:hypothetical protein [Methylocella tundrae]|uniref:hypothetical protein n=1 Tax=Methylocella tundrae TaxID=227605 RepID=UPI00106D4E75|nr:hypothetical protein [Methylocella tundrae]WPP04216.1 hypothetical protein SIN04_17450 [Methylocella tundrae]